MLNIQTELEVNMTVRMTGRDQFTGQDKQKINALFEAVEALGGVINYPTNPLPTNPTDVAQWIAVNAAYANNQFTYDGGTYDLDLGGGAQINPLMFAHMPVAAGNSYKFTVPDMAGIPFLNTTVTTEPDSFSNILNITTPAPFAKIESDNGNLTMDIVSASGTTQYTVPVQAGYQIEVAIERSALIFNVYDLTNTLLDSYAVIHEWGNQPRHLWFAAVLASTSTQLILPVEYLPENRGIGGITMHPYVLTNATIANEGVIYTGGQLSNGKNGLRVQKEIEIGQFVKVWCSPSDYLSATLVVDSELGSSGVIWDAATYLIQSNDPSAGTPDVRLIQGRSFDANPLLLSEVSNGFYAKITRVASDAVHVSVEDVYGNILKQKTSVFEDWPQPNFWLEFTFEQNDAVFSTAFIDEVQA